MAAIGISTTPTARTGPAGDMAKAVNQSPDAAAPKKPAPSDERQPATATHSARRSVASSQAVRAADCMAWATTNTVTWAASGG